MLLYARSKQPRNECTAVDCSESTSSKRVTCSHVNLVATTRCRVATVVLDNTRCVRASSRVVYAERAASSLCTSHGTESTYVPQSIQTVRCDSCRSSLRVAPQILHVVVMMSRAGRTFTRKVFASTKTRTRWCSVLFSLNLTGRQVDSTVSSSPAEDLGHVCGHTFRFSKGRNKFRTVFQNNAILHVSTSSSRECIVPARHVVCLGVPRVIVVIYDHFDFWENGCCRCQRCSTDR